MPKRPQLLGIIEGPISEDNPIPFMYADEESFAILPETFIDEQAAKFDTLVNDQPTEPTISEITVPTNLDIHLIIDSPGGHPEAWIKYVKALSIIQSQGAAITAHILGKAGGLAGDIFVRANNHAAIAYSQLALTAGDVSDHDLRKIITKAADESQTLITEPYIQEKMQRQRASADQDWDMIKRFLLSQPGSPHRKDFLAKIAAAEQNKPRTLELEGQDIAKVNPLIKVYRSVREMFKSLCDQTDIELDQLPPTALSRIFTYASIAEHVFEEIGLRLTLCTNPNGELSAFCDNTDLYLAHQQDIVRIITYHLKKYEFAQIIEEEKTPAHQLN